MDRKFEPHDTVMYGGHGVCTLVEIAEKDFGGESKRYYVLCPAHSGSSVFYVPLDSEPLVSKMNHVKNAQELQALAANCRAAEWIEEDRSRQNIIKKIIDVGDTESLLSSFRMLHIHKEEMSSLGKKLRAADDRFMKDIEKLLLGEFSLAFELEKDELMELIIG